MSIGRLTYMLLLFGGLSVGEARADEQAPSIPLMIYAGSSHAAQLRVRRVTEETAKAVDARTLPDLVAGGSPYLVGVEDQSSCADSPSTNEQVLRQVVDSHEMRVNMNLSGASDLLKAAAESLGCLSQPVESTTGARVHFVLGILHFAGGDEAAARGAFDRALSFRPDLAWDDDFAPDARPLFDAARAATGQRSSAILRIVAGSVDQVRIDGQAPAGFERHLVAALEKRIHQRHRVVLRQRLASGDLHKAAGMLGYACQYVLDAHLDPFVKGVGGIAPAAPKIAPGQTDKDTGTASVSRLTLDRIEDLVDLKHGPLILQQPSAVLDR